MRFKLMLASLAATGAFAAHSATYYVEKTGNDISGDGSKDNPFLTIQKAVNTASGDGHTVIVGPGDYGESEGTHTDADNAGMARVCVDNKRIRIMSSDGPEVTRIIGKQSNSSNGLGADAVRCVMFRFGVASLLEGFTLCNGGTKISGLDEGTGGGILVRGVTHGSTDVWIHNCIISNCVAYAGSAAQMGMLIHCKIVNNRARDTLLRQSYAYGCLIKDNQISANCNQFGKIVQSTFVGNSKLDGALGFNNVYIGNGTEFTAEEIRQNCSVQDKTDGVLVCDAANGDYRPVRGCVAATAGNANVMNDADNTFGWYGYGSWWSNPSPKGVGLDGVKFSAADGMCAAGAFGEVVSGISIEADQGGLTIEGGSPGFTPLTDGVSVTLTRGPGTRPCIGYTVNGTTNLFDVVESRTFTKADADAAGGGLAISALYAPHWYVNANADPAKGPVGDDANTGFTPKTAKRTLKAAMEAAGLVEGDTVHAAPGDYNEGTMLHGVAFIGGTPSVLARVVVVGGVRLVADEGRDVTFITGERDPNGTAEGLGPNAVRCVVVLTGGSVAGFTIRGGRTAATASDWDDDTTAAGVLGRTPERTSVVDCVITDCVAYVAGALRLITAERCKVLGCVATGADKWISQDAGFYSTYFDHNKATYLNMSARDTVNCTFGAHNDAVFAFASPVGSVKNTLSLLTGVGGTCQRCYFTGFSRSTLEDGCAVKSAAELALDEDGRPVFGSSCAIDAANAGYLTGNHAVADADGVQRIYNGAPDIGCFEADWRGTFAKDISKSSGFSVLAATPNVVESAETSTVRIPAGERLTAKWLGKGNCSYSLTVTLPGNGTLSVVSNGNRIATVTGPVAGRELVFSCDAAEFPLEFAYSGDDSYAEILNLCRTGLMLFLR